MRLSLGMEARQVQVQKLAPRMIQSMEILQLPIMALQERIEQEMNENPLLEVQEVDPTLPEESDERDNPDAPSDVEKELVVDGKDGADDFERLLNMDGDMPSTFDDSFRRSANRIQDDMDRQHDLMANAASRPESLNDFLMHQLGELDLEPDIEKMAERIISSLDARDGGYFKMSLMDLVPPDASPEQVNVAHEALHVIQSMEPAGIAARDLRECLLLQLTPDMEFHEEMKTLIESHLEDLAENRLPLIQRKTGYSIETIQETRLHLLKLNPKPGFAFAETFVPNVTPDVRVEQNDHGEYRVVLDDDRTPTLRISEYYRRRLQSGLATPEEREFIKRKINAAQWLIESIEQRRNTLTRVAQAIVNYQRSFLDNGPEYIEPLKMQQIADEVGVHVTTVSRAVDDKLIDTPRGIFPLKRFFVGGTRSEDGEDVAWDVVRLKLQEVIDAENKASPYSDDELVNELKKHGLNVARRTITKYRRKMNIPSSRQRRDWTKV
ncbi:MAG: RNA polymerase factor sigma-54 [Planctomycetales bacterium]|nr:RNA polymerase factor sigma-54 [Planctomycetales bacterium]